MKKMLLGTACMACALNLYAGSVATTIIPGGSQTQTENRAFAGLAWTLKDQFSFIPDITFGIRSLRVKSSDTVNGAELSARISLQNGIAFDSARLSYIGGQRDLLGNIGLGYSFSDASILGTLAVQAAHVRVGSDLLLTDKKFVPYLEILTLDKPHNVDKKPNTIINNQQNGFN